MKNFDNWNKKKKIINNDKLRFYTVREIWWCYLGLNIGSEQDGSEEKFLRPVVIVRSFGLNTCLVIPLTTSTRKHPLRIMVGEVDGEQASALLSQMKVVDTKRFLEKISFMEKDSFYKMKKAIKNLF